MSYLIRVIDEAEHDIDDAIIWYENRDSRLGLHFEVLIDETFARIGANPYLY